MTVKNEVSSNAGTAILTAGVMLMPTEPVLALGFTALGALVYIARYWIGLKYGDRDGDGERDLEME